VKAKNTQILLTLAALIVAAGLCAWWILKPQKASRPNQGRIELASSAAKERSQPPPFARAVPPASQPEAPGAPPPPSSPDEATDALLRGLELMKAGKLLEARRVLSAAIFSGALSEAQAEQARVSASELAEDTLFTPRFFDGDPYTFQYTFASGDTVNTVERKLKLHVPAQLILKVNGLARGSAIRAGQSVKMIQGPFHAVVSKGQFTLDLYLQREGMEKIFIKRLKVGLGADGSTPLGAWKVGLGKKMINATWFPPASSRIHKPLRPGDPEYPLGKAGYWIGLVGTDPNTAAFEGYGLHGTNAPASIGQAVSLGCIRLADEDIELVFSLLYEEWSTVRVIP
jgi:lipoprotein-anchoring transpeptidase ErfK/SrfK